jgi:dihydroneopterin aldolase
MKTRACNCPRFSLGVHEEMGRGIAGTQGPQGIRWTPDLGVCGPRQQIPGKHDLMIKSRQDRLTLVGVRLQPRLGVTPGERRFPQACVADISVWGDFEAAASTDELADALDYSRILAKVVEAAHTREYNLLEALAYRLARTVLEAFPAHRVNVKVSKHPATMIDKLDHVEVEVDES